jgi:hypothetical protein
LIQQNRQRIQQAGLPAPVLANQDRQAGVKVDVKRKTEAAKLFNVERADDHGTFHSSRRQAMQNAAVAFRVSLFYRPSRDLANILISEHRSADQTDAVARLAFQPSRQFQFQQHGHGHGKGQLAASHQFVNRNSGRLYWG